jgi:Xaa-Pro dipeptidase
MKFPLPPRDCRPSRRRFLQASTSTALGTLAIAQGTPGENCPEGLPPALVSLKPLGSRIRPITPEEFAQRIHRVQELMAGSTPSLSLAAPVPKYDTLFLAPGSSLYYFTGIRWAPSERLLGVVIPRRGDPILVVPGFEEGRLREKLRLPMEIHAWQEDESPTKVAAAALSNRGIRSGRMGVEESTGFTYFDRFREAAPGFEFVSADPLTIACRAHKSPHELELMRLACDATFDVFRAVFASLKEGMSQDDIARLVEAGFAKMQLQGSALVLLGASAALPHGTLQPQKLKEGAVVLVDGGCKLEGYESDVTRTGVLGKPSEKVARVFEIVRKAQDAALDAARAGHLSGNVDDAARAVITSAGYGPDYKFFTHRLGHGIGLDGHEHPYLVRGSKTVLEPSMTFSNEPGIYVPGEFGVRCEDDMVITADSPAQLLTQNFAVSLEKPFG